MFPTSADQRVEEPSGEKVISHLALWNEKGLMGSVGRRSDRDVIESCTEFEYMIEYMCEPGQEAGKGREDIR